MNSSTLGSELSALDVVQANLVPLSAQLANATTANGSASSGSGSSSSGGNGSNKSGAESMFDRAHSAVGFLMTLLIPMLLSVL